MFVHLFPRSSAGITNRHHADRPHVLDQVAHLLFQGGDLARHVVVVEVERRVGQVDEQVEQDDQAGVEDDDAEHQGVVPVEGPGDEELAEAGWFRPDSIPRVPPPISIARQLIDAFVRRNSGRIETEA